MAAIFDGNNLESFLPPPAELLKTVAPGLWMAVSRDRSRILASGCNLAQVADQAKQMGEDDPIFAKNPEIAEYHAF